MEVKHGNGTKVVAIILERVPLVVTAVMATTAAVY